jgi:hypothetical protein
LKKLLKKKKSLQKLSGDFFEGEGIMDGFIRRDIPSMTNKSLIEIHTFNNKMMDVALAQAQTNAIQGKKVKSYSYYSNNKNIIEAELDRRIRDKECIWYSGSDGYMTAEDAKQMLTRVLQEKINSIRYLTDVDANAIIINWDTDIKFVDTQLGNLLHDYP